jgi:hypothetical protein
MLWEVELPASQKNHQEETCLTISQARNADFIGVHCVYGALRICEPKLADIGPIWLLFGWERVISISLGDRRTSLQFKNRRMSVDKTQRWATSTLHGFAEISHAHFGIAARSWLQAADYLQAADDHDPLLAASLSNAGSAYLILDERHDADRILLDAEQAWLRVLSSIATLDIPMTGASSSFHFRLAAKAPDALTDASRLRYRRLAEAALAIIRFNRLFVDEQSLASGIVELRTHELKTMLSEVLGARSVEVSLLSTSADADVAVSIYAGKVSEFADRRQTLATALSEECAKLETAVALTALLGPWIFTAIKNEKTKTATGFDTYELELN